MAAGSSPASASAGSRRRIRTRRKRGSAFIGSSWAASPAAAVVAARRARDTARKGRNRTSPSRSISRRMAARPKTPEPRSSRIRNVSAWSSRLWAVRRWVAPASRAASISSRYRAAPGGRLDAGRRLRPDPAQDAGGKPAIPGHGDDIRGNGVGARRQAVVDGEDDDLRPPAALPPAVGRGEKREGIAAAGDGNRDRRRCGERREQRRDLGFGQSGGAVSSAPRRLRHGRRLSVSSGRRPARSRPAGGARSTNSDTS